MPTNPNVLKDRNKFIGGSEIAAILNISPFKTRWELLQEKAGIVVNEFNGNAYTQYGDVMEEKIRSYINKKHSLGLKEPLYESTTIQKHDVIDLRCNHDGINVDTNLEVKTTSQVHEELIDYKYYVVQLLYGMMLAGKEKGILAVYERPEDFNEVFDENRLQIFEITMDDFKDWQKEIEEEIEEFCIDLAKLKENPFLQEQDLLPEDIQTKINALVAMEEQIAFAKTIQKKYEEEKEKLLQEMIKMDKPTFETPNGTKITWVKGSPDTEIEEEYYDEDKFIEENPELHEKYHNKLAEYKEVKKVIKKGRKDSLRITIPKK